MPGYYQSERGSNRYGGGGFGYRGSQGSGYNRGGGFRRHGGGGYDNYNYFGGQMGNAGAMQQPDLSYNRPSVKSRLVDVRHITGAYDNRSPNQSQNSPQARKRPRDFYEYYDIKHGAWQPLVPSVNFDGSIKKRLKFSKKKNQSEENNKEKEGDDEEVVKPEDNSADKSEDAVEKEEIKKDDESEPVEEDANNEVKEETVQQPDEKEGVEKETDEVADGEENKEKKKETKVSDLDVQALHCHMCDLNEFASLEEFNDHLESIGHYDMAHAYHSKNAAVLQLLRSNAQFVTMKQIAETRGSTTGKIKTKECFNCHCHVMGKITDHLKTPEHLMVVNFMRVKCCNRNFTNPVDLGEHKLTIPHLKKHFLNLQKMEEAEKQTEIEGLSEVEIETIEKEESNEDKTVANSTTVNTNEDAKENGQDKDTVASIAAYDGGVVFAPEYINKIARYQCRACWQWFFIKDELKDMHCRSHNHYDKVVAKKKEEEARKRRAEEKRLKKEQEKREKQEELEEEAAAAAAAATKEEASSDVTLEDLETVEDVIGDVEENMEAEEADFVKENNAKMEVDSTDANQPMPEEEIEKEVEPEPEEQQTTKTRRGRGRGRGRGKR